MIAVQNLTKSFRNVQVLKGVSMEIQTGEIFGIAGRSGVGKSTLLRCMNGLETYDAGSLQVDGVEVRDLKEKELRLFRKNMGMIFQSFSLITRATVYQNIAYPMRCWHYDKQTIDAKVKELLQVVGMPEKINSRASELSGGQKQRVAIARALAMDPKVLLCDEATSALDPKSTLAITELLREINQKLGITVVVVTHEMDVIRRICDRMVVIEDGQIQASGGVEEVFEERPEALTNLLGTQGPPLPKEGINLEFFYSTEQNELENLVADLMRTLEFQMKIVGGGMEEYKGKTVCSMIVNLPQNLTEKACAYLTQRGVRWRLMCRGEEDKVQ